MHGGISHQDVYVPSTTVFQIDGENRCEYYLSPFEVLVIQKETD